MTHLFYLFGIPGAGKTTLFQSLLGHLPCTPSADPIPHLVYPNGIQLGVARKAFSGTDGLSMAIQPRVIEWLSTYPSDLIAAEGDRLTNAKFFNQVRQLGYQLTLVLLDCPSELAALRREERKSTQKPVWIKGRETKIRNLRRSASLVLDATLPLTTLTDILVQHPFFVQLLAD